MKPNIFPGRQWPPLGPGRQRRPRTLHGSSPRDVHRAHRTGFFLQPVTALSADRTRSGDGGMECHHRDSFWVGWRPDILPLFDAQKEVRARGSGPGRRLRPPARPPRHGPFVSALNTCHPGQASKISKGFILLNTMLPFFSCKFLCTKFCSYFLFCSVIIAVSLFRFSYCRFLGVQCSGCHMRQNSDGPQPFGSHFSIRIHTFHHSD